jgi:tRNA(adenine34) deaminase
MWESLSLPWQKSFEQGWIAYQSGSVPIGAVLTDGTGHICSTGRSRSYEQNSDDLRHIHGNLLSHAEVNALLSFDDSRYDPHKCLLYTTVEPCPLCIGAVCMARIKKIMYAARDPYAGSIDLLDATNYLRAKGISSEGPMAGDFENIVIGIQVEFFLRAKRRSLHPLMEAWEKVLPKGVELGKELVRSDRLLDLRDRGASARDTFDSIHALLKQLGDHSA